MDLSLRAHSRNNLTSFAKRDCGACSERISEESPSLLQLRFVTVFLLAMTALFLVYSTRIIRKSILKNIIDFDYDYLYTYRMMLMEMSCKHEIPSLIITVFER